MDGPDLIYYAVSAQVIPTLLLIGFALWFRDLRPNRTWMLVWIVPQMLLSLAGTAAAVWILATGEATGLTERLVRYS